MRVLSSILLQSIALGPTVLTTGLSITNGFESGGAPLPSSGKKPEADFGFKTCKGSDHSRLDCVLICARVCVCVRSCMAHVHVHV